MSSQVAFAMLGIGMLNITWSTLLQEKIDWAWVQGAYDGSLGYQAFLMHRPIAGSVCYLGIFSGILILLFNAIQFGLIQRFLKRKDSKQLKKLLDASIGINVVIFFLMLGMNSFASHYYVEGIHRHGLFENSLLYFVAQFTAIGLLYPKKK